MSHQFFISADLKHGYHVVLLHEDDRKYFFFTIPGTCQLQSTRMSQGSMSAGFMMNELICRALGPLPSEPSLLHSVHPDIPPFLTFYMDDMFGGYRSFEEAFAFL